MSDPYTPPKADIAGGTEPEAKRSRLVRALVSIAFVVAILGILAAIAIPSYSDYTPRAKLSEVILALSGGRTSVAEFFEQHKRLPKDAAEAGLPWPMANVSKYVRQLAYDGRSGELSAVVQGITSDMEGKTIRLKAVVNSGELTWRCYTPDLPKKYLPSSCRD